MNNLIFISGLQKSRFFAFLYLLAVSHAALANGFEQASTLTVGDTWTFESVDLRNGEMLNKVVHRVESIDKDKNGPYYRVKNSRVNTAHTYRVVNENINLFTTYQNKRYEFNLYNWPLVAGKKTQIYAEQQGTSERLVTTGHCIMVGKETIKVPVGEFEAMKIDCDYYLRNTTDEGMFKSSGSYYYVPKIKYYAKYRVHYYDARGGVTWAEERTLSEYKVAP